MFRMMAISAMMMKIRDMNGTSMEATLPMRLMPPMMIRAVKKATTTPMMILKRVVSILKQAIIVPEILLVCTPLMPSAANRHTIEAM